MRLRLVDAHAAVEQAVAILDGLPAERAARQVARERRDERARLEIAPTGELDARTATRLEQATVLAPRRETAVKPATRTRGTMRRRTAVRRRAA